MLVVGASVGSLIIDCIYMKGVGGMTEDIELDFDFDDLLFQYFRERQEELKGKGKLFAHYTTAESAMKILDDQTVMLRNARLMNDFSEVDYGQTILGKAWRTDDLGQNFTTFLNSIEDGLGGRLEDVFNELVPHQNYETYIFSMIEHSSEDKEFGKLSMWRAYGGDSGVALVFNPELLLDEHPNLYAFNLPVLYVGADEIYKLISSVLQNLKRNQEKVKEVDRKHLITAIAVFLHYLTLSTKHPGFSEEKEWRVIYCPTFNKSKQIEEREKVFRGIPQTAHFLKLEKSDEEGWSDLRLSKILKNLIIGPTQYPQQLSLSFVKKLSSLGVDAPGSIISTSNIPLRRA